MMRPQDTSLNFTSSTGYTFDSDDVEFVSGVARALTGFTGTATVETPAIDTTGWDRIAAVALTATESTQYQHNFLVSTDGGTTWQTSDGLTWYVVDVADIGAAGMTEAQLTNLRTFPPVGNFLSFLVQINKSDAAAVGSISQITVTYLEDATVPDELEFPDANPPINTVLNIDLELVPEAPVAVEFIQPASQSNNVGGHRITTPLSTGVRSVFTAAFICVGEEQRDLVEGYILQHQSDWAVGYQPPWENEQLSYLFGEYSIEKVAPNVWRIPVRFIEVFP
jgi:hypothetical protein